MKNSKKGQSKHGLEVLYVEDQEVNQKVFSLMLKDMGCNVEVASNGSEAVEMAKKKSYDIIFMDLFMPVMSGLAAAKKINANIEKSPPIIAVTAYYDIIEESELKTNGIVDIISKPYGSKDVFEKIVYWVQESIE